MTMITIIGRGHSGTRAMSHTLSASGVFMGHPLNASGDLLPPHPMYEACRIFARCVKWHPPLDPCPSDIGQWRWNGGVSLMDPDTWRPTDIWQLRDRPTMDNVREIPAAFTSRIHTYLTSVLESPAEHKGWKIPETTLVFPWIVRMFPDIKYIYWIRDPRDCILGRHLTDDLADFGVPYSPTEDELMRRAISWKYQYDLVKATPKPKHWIEVRFEDFVLRQEETLTRLEEFLGIALARIPVRHESVGRWHREPLDQQTKVNQYHFLEPAMRAYDYDLPNHKAGKDAPTVDCLSPKEK
jgi:hypothetical protein